MLVEIGLMSDNMLSCRHKTRQTEGLNVDYENQTGKMRRPR